MEGIFTWRSIKCSFCKQFKKKMLISEPLQACFVVFKKKRGAHGQIKQFCVQTRQHFNTDSLDFIYIYIQLH